MLWGSQPFYWIHSVHFYLLNAFNKFIRVDIIRKHSWFESSFNCNSSKVYCEFWMTQLKVIYGFMRIAHKDWDFITNNLMLKDILKQTKQSTNSRLKLDKFPPSIETLSNTWPFWRNYLLLLFLLTALQPFFSPFSFFQKVQIWVNFSAQFTN